MIATAPAPKMTHAEYQRYNFFRAPEWRWERVLRLVDRSGFRAARCTRRDDAAVRGAKNFLLRWRNGDADAREVLLWENPALHDAYRFHRSAAEDPREVMAIQARLLARMTPEEVAATHGIHPDTVRWYADLFFDVVPYLDARDWITKRVLLPALVRSPPQAAAPDPTRAARVDRISESFYDGSLKLFAYFGGRHVVDEMLAGMAVGKPAVSGEAVSQWHDEGMSRSIRMRSNQAAKLFELNRYNVMELFQIHAKLVELDRSEDNQAKSAGSYERSVKALVEEIPWAVGADGEKLYGGTVLGRLDAMAGEARDDEVLMLASGRTAGTLSDYPAELPPPRKVKTAALTAPDPDK